MAPKKRMSFAEAVDRLESIVNQLDQGEVPLEESFILFEEGVELAKFCSAKLNEAEKKIEKLSKDGLGKLAAIPLETDDE